MGEARIKGGKHRRFEGAARIKGKTIKNGGRGLGMGLGELLPIKFLEFRTSKIIQSGVYMYLILAHIMCPSIKRAPLYIVRFFYFQFKTICITYTTLLHGMDASIVVIYTLDHTSSCFIAFN